MSTSDVPVDPAHQTLPRIEVLVVDDSDLMRTLLRGILEEAGWRVWEASSAEEGLALVTKRDIWLVISDLSLGRGLNGMEFLENLAVLYPHTRRILISGAFSPNRKEKFSFPVLLKPFRPQELLALISQLESARQDTNDKSNDAGDEPSGCRRNP